MTVHTVTRNPRVSMPVELFQETLLALRLRRSKLMREQGGPLTPPVRAISERQLARVEEAGELIANAIGESF